MAYVYDSVVAILGGKKLTSSLKEGSVVKDWSPNSYKRVAFLTDGVVIETHGFPSQVRIFNFDLLKVAQDLEQANKYKNPLRALYDYKAFSCLEEVLISPSLVTEKMVADYLSTLVSSHRLRAVALIPKNVKVEDIKSTIEEVQKYNSDKGQVADTTLISELISDSKVKVLEGSKDFYNRYYLRPNMYALDGENGRLRKYFDRVKLELSSKVEASDKLNLATSFIQYDLANGYSDYLLVVNFLLSDLAKAESKKEGSPYLSLIKALKTFSIAKGSTYTSGLIDALTSSDNAPELKDLARVYKALGFFREGGSEKPLKDQQGYLRSFSILSANVYPEVLKLVKRRVNDSLNSLTFSEGVSKEEVVRQALRVLVGEVVGTENTFVTTNFRSKEDEDLELAEAVRESLSDELASSIFELVEQVGKDYRKTVGSYLKWSEGKPKFSSKELVNLGLVRQEELLSLLGYTGGTDSLTLVNSLGFSGALDKLARTFTRSIAESLSQPWLSLSDVEKVDYILRRVGNDIDSIGGNK